MNLKKIAGFQDLQFQQDTIARMVTVCHQMGGCCLFDSTGLGKSYMAASIAINLKGNDAKILILAQKELHDSWKRIMRNSASFYTIAASVKKLQGERFDVIIVDEAHSYRNHKSQGFLDLWVYIRQCKAYTLLLTATPFQNNMTELRNLLSLIPFRQKSIPALLLPILFKDAMELEKVSAVEKAFDDDPFWGDFRQNMFSQRMGHALGELASVLKLISSQNTRSSISRDYPDDLKAIGAFPFITQKKIDCTEYLDGAKVSKTIATIEKMNFAMQNVLAYTEKKTTGNMMGIHRTFLLKRLDSSVAAFKESVQKNIDRIEQILQDLSGFVTISEVQVAVDPDFYAHLKQDLESLRSIQKLWENETDDRKVNAMLDEVAIYKKSVIFTEYVATFEVIVAAAKARGMRVLGYTHYTDKKVMGTITDNFDANLATKNDYDVLVSTDILSQGVSLHKADFLVHYDLRWNFSRIVQRNGRVDRIAINGNSKITIATFSVESVVEEILKLEEKLSNKEAFSDIILDPQADLPPIYSVDQFPFEPHDVFLIPSASQTKHLLAVETTSGVVFIQDRGAVADLIQTMLVAKFEAKSIVPVDLKAERLKSQRKSKVYWRDLVSKKSDYWALIDYASKVNKYCAPLDAPIWYGCKHLKVEEQLALMPEMQDVRGCSVWLKEPMYMNYF